MGSSVAANTTIGYLAPQQDVSPIQQRINNLSSAVLSLDDNLVLLSEKLSPVRLFSETADSKERALAPVPHMSNLEAALAEIAGRVDAINAKVSMLKDEVRL